MHILLILFTGCLFILNGGQDAHAEIFVPQKHQVLEQGGHPDFSFLNHEDRDKAQNLYCRLRTRADVQQNHYLFAVLASNDVLSYTEQPEELVSVRIHTSNEYFRSFLKRLLYPKHGFW